MPQPPTNAYQADRGKIQTVRWLAVLLGLVVGFGAAPGVMHFDGLATPTWAWIVLFVAAIETIFLAWMLVTPDWASLLVVMLVFLLAATGYGAMAVLAANAAPGQPLPWGLEPIRPYVPRWSASVLLADALAAYLCGHAGRKWRRAFQVQAQRTRT